MKRELLLILCPVPIHEDYRSPGTSSRARNLARTSSLRYYRPEAEILENNFFKK
jgi:hypothetical protein